MSGIFIFRKALYDEGARRIWVLDLGPQGCMPMTLTKYAANIKMSDIDECGCARPYNEAVALYNRLLREQLRRLQSMLLTSDIVFVDTFHIQYSMIKHAPRYGMYTCLIASNSYTKKGVVAHSL